MPTFAIWTGAVNSEFGNSGNWIGGVLPQTGYDVVFRAPTYATEEGQVYGTAVSCNGMYAASGVYNSVTLESNYTATVTLVGGFSTKALVLAGGTLNQPTPTTPYTATNISVIGGATGGYASGLSWTGGTLNATTHLADLSITGSGTTALFAPTNGGTVYCGSNIYLSSGAVGTQLAGTINATNPDLTFEVAENSSYDVNPGNALSAFISSIYGTHFRVKPGAAWTLHSGDWTFQGDVRNQGTFSLKGETMAIILNIAANPNDPDGVYSYLQSAGATYLYGSSTLLTGAARGVKITGGILATKYAVTERSSHDSSAGISGKELLITGGDIYIGYGATHPFFGTLSVTDLVSWQGGTYHPNVRSYANGSVGDSDLWIAGGRFEVANNPTISPIVVDAEGAVVQQAQSGKYYVIIKADTPSNPPPAGAPSYNATLWDLITIAPPGDDTKVVQYNLQSK